MDSGDIRIDKFELDNFGNKLDLTEFVTDLNIYESIFEPNIKATMSIFDGAGLNDRITWAGSKVTITYTSSPDVDPTTMVFIVDGTEAATPIPGDKGQTYFVRMFSEECLRGLAITVGEIFNKMSPEEMIKKIIINKLNSKKPFITDKTSALDTINCANLRPFQAIDKIKKRSVSRDKVSSSFVFFENKHGFNFKSIESMLETARKDPQVTEGDRNFYLDSMQHKGVDKTSWRQILAFERSVSQSLSGTVWHGGMNSKIYAYDISTGDHYEFTYVDSKNSAEFSIDGKSLTYKRVAVDDIMKTGDAAAGMMVAPINDTNDLERIKKELYVRAYMTKLMGNVVRIQIHGDNRITVGTAVKLNLPVIDGATTKHTNEMAGGVYLISKVRHMITPAGGRYSQSCELIRTGMFE
jgi:hypothetical protein